MPFEFTNGRPRQLINTDTGSTLLLTGTPDIDIRVAKYVREGAVYRLGVTIKRKPSSGREGDSPCICITTGDVLFAFAPHSQLNGAEIEACLKEMVQMISFAAHHYRIAQNHCVWTDFDEVVAEKPEIADRLNGYIPTSDELSRWSCG